MTLKELQEQAKGLGIKYRGLKKAELEAAIKDATAVKLSDIPATTTRNVHKVLQIGKYTFAYQVQAELSRMSKGEARRMRKALRGAGKVYFASLPRKIAA